MRGGGGRNDGRGIDIHTHYSGGGEEGGREEEKEKDDNVNITKVYPTLLPSVRIMHGEWEETNEGRENSTQLTCTRGEKKPLKIDDWILNNIGRRRQNNTIPCHRFDVYCGIRSVAER